ncbi:MAG: DUF3426 domain-containing protein [Deltaproteobacteria bacterium]|nr:DUF3426 domain-containing protein [Deltaproteobacteria bacterium]
MIIECEHCNTKFRLDDSRIKPNGVKVRCTKCQNVFIVTPPPPPDEVQVEEIFGVHTAFDGKPPVSFAPTPTEGGGEDGTEEPRAVDDGRAEAPDLSFSEPDFGSLIASKEAPEDEGAVKRPAGVDEGAFGDDAQWFDMAKGEGEGLSGNAPSFNTKPMPPMPDDGLFPSFDDEPAEEEKVDIEPPSPPSEHEADLTDAPVKAGEEKAPAPATDGFDFGFDGEEKEEAEEPAASDEERAAREEFTLTPPPASRPSDEKVIPFSAGYNKNGRPAAKSAQKTEEDGKFEDLFTRTLSEAPKEHPEDLGIDAGDFEDEEGPRAEPAGARAYAAPGGKGLLLAALIFIIGGGAIYFSGIIDILARMLAPSSHSASSAVEIESISGYMAENKNFGKFFVIEARIKNTSDEAQPIKTITGVAYNGRGKAIATRSVSAGRVASPEDLKNLTKQDLLNQFRDSSGGVIPPRGTVPVMVPFTEMPAGMAEYGINIVRD